MTDFQLGFAMASLTIFLAIVGGFFIGYAVGRLENKKTTTK